MDHSDKIESKAPSEQDQGGGEWRTEIDAVVNADAAYRDLF